MVELFCAVVGEQGSAFPVTIDASESVGDMKFAIKAKNNLKAVDADKLQLFLARKGDGTWLESSTDDVKKLKKGGKTALMEALTHEDYELQGESGLQMVLKDMPEPSTDQIHILVVVPKQAIPHALQGVGGKRVRVDEWFADETFSQTKKSKLDEDEPDQFTRNFTMAGFPPLAHPMQKYKKIVERDAYAVIFAELMGKVKVCFEAESDANMVVTGNPGTGKSRFYLY